MEKTRTIYRIRKMKNGVLMNLLTLMLGASLFSLMLSLESTILSFMREKAALLINGSDSLNVNFSMGLCDKAFDALKSASVYSILFSLEGFLMVFFFVRMSSKTWKFSNYAPLILGLGTLAIFCYYFLVGLIAPTSGQFESVEISYRFLRISGAFLILTSNILFIYQLFIQIVLEKIEE